MVKNGNRSVDKYTITKTYATKLHNYLSLSKLSQSPIVTI